MYNVNQKNRNQLVDSKEIKRYLYGGKAIVTLESPSGVWHTYLFKKPVAPEGFPDDVFFVYALHEFNTAFYVGMVEEDCFRLTRHSRFLADTEIVRGAFYIMRMANEPNLQTPMKLYHEGVCSVCGRPLTTPKSIQVGIGPKCLKKLRVQ